MLAMSEAEIPPVVSELITRYFISFKTIPPSLDLEALPQESRRCNIVLLVQLSDEDLDAFTARLGRALLAFQKAAILCVLQEASLQAARGRDWGERVFALSPHEFQYGAKFEYLILAKTRALYMHIPVTDLFPMTTIPFTAFYRMTLNQRYLAVVLEGMILKEEKFRRLEKTSGIYVSTHEVRKYVDYVQTYFDMAGIGLRKRVHSVFLDLIHATMKLNEEVLFDLRSAKEEKLLLIYQRLEGVARELVSLLKGTEDLWEVLFEAFHNELCTYWRAPWVASYGALISVRSGKGDPVLVLMAGLLCDNALLDFPQDIYLRSVQQGTVAMQEQEVFRFHPVQSLNRLLSKEVPLSEEIKAIVACSHENAFSTGFPNQTPAAHVPVESLLLSFAEKIDEQVRGKTASELNFRLLREKLWEKEDQEQKTYDKDFLAAIGDTLL